MKEQELTSDDLLAALGDLCDEFELEPHKELSAVSSLMAILGYKNNMKKEVVMKGLAHVIDTVYKELDDEQ
jgi:hypothetical protein